jgi:hypothetical protein
VEFYPMIGANYLVDMNIEEQFVGNCCFGA